MKIEMIGQDLYITNIKDFDIEQILECGQCFRYKKLSKQEYIIVAYNRILRIKQSQDTIILYNTTEEDYKNIWHTYFDMDMDYSLIKNELLLKDNVLEDSIKNKHGIRILRQELFEMLISFIISQSKQIPHIMQIVETLSIRYGTKIGSYDGKDYYSFPTVFQLSQASEEDLRDCKTGFRAPYITDACDKIMSNQINLESLRTLPTEEVKKILMQIKGVGNKISDCVLLFGLGRTEVFPTDVWVKRIVEHLYIKEDAKIEVIQEFAKQMYGKYAGYAQQYLFYYGRENKIGANKEQIKEKASNH